MDMKMKLTSGLLGIAALLMVGQVSAAVISLTPGVTNVTVNEAFSLTIEGSAFGTGVSSGGVFLSWDTSIVQLTSAAADIDNSLLGNGFLGVVTVGAGTAEISGFSLAGLAGPDFIFATLDFVAIPPPGTTDVIVSASPFGDWQDLIGQPVIVDTFNNARVNVSAVPVPAAVWLFGSGLIGLVGIARRRTTTIA